MSTRSRTRLRWTPRAEFIAVWVGCLAFSLGCWALLVVAIVGLS